MFNGTGRERSKIQTEVKTEEQSNCAKVPKGKSKTRVKRIQAGVRKNRKEKNRMSHRQQAEEARTGGRKNGAGTGTEQDQTN